MIISSLLYVESRSSTLTIWQYNFLCRIISQSILNTAACILTCNKGNVKHHHLCSLSLRFDLFAPFEPTSVLAKLCLICLFTVMGQSIIEPGSTDFYFLRFRLVVGWLVSHFYGNSSKQSRHGKHKHHPLIYYLGRNRHYRPLFELITL